MQGVTEGRNVHYVDPNGGYHRAAIITAAPIVPGQDEPESHDGTVDLAVFYPHERPVRQANGVRYDPDQALDTWHWIERA